MPNLLVKDLGTFFVGGRGCGTKDGCVIRHMLILIPAAAEDGLDLALEHGGPAPGGSQTRFNSGETWFHFAPPNQAVRIPYRIVLEKQPDQPLWLVDPPRGSSVGRGQVLQWC